MSESNVILGYDSCFGNNMDLYVGTSIICPKSYEENLIEKMIDIGLKPWKKKWSDYTSKNKPDKKIKQLIEYIKGSNQLDIFVYYQNYKPNKIDSIAPIHSTYNYQLNKGERQIVKMILDEGHCEETRQKIRPFYNHHNKHKYDIELVDGFPKADKCYPQVIVSDYISGYISQYVKKNNMGEIWNILQNNINKTEQIKMFNECSTPVSSSNLPRIKYGNFEFYVGIRAWDNRNGLEKGKSNMKHKRLVKNNLDNKVIKSYLFK